MTQYAIFRNLLVQDLMKYFYIVDSLPDIGTFLEDVLINVGDDG